MESKVGLQGMGRVIRTSEDRARLPAVVDAVIDAGVQLGRSPAEVALAWLHGGAKARRVRHIDHHDHRTAYGPEQLDNNLLALDLALPQDLVDRLDQVSRILLQGPIRSQCGDASADAGRPSSLGGFACLQGRLTNFLLCAAN